MFYRICHTLNIVLSFLFIAILAFGFLRSNNLPTETTITFITIMLVVTVIFLIFDFICARFNKFNKEQISLTKKQMITGKILLGFNIIACLVVFFILIAGVSVTFSPDSGSIINNIGTMYAMLVFFFLIGTTAIANLFFFFFLQKENKAISKDVINDIGK